MEDAVARPWSQSDRREFFGGFGARIISGDDEATLLRLWQKKRGEAEPEDIFGNPHRPAGASERAHPKPSASPVRAAHAEFVTALAEHPPRPIPLDADATDLEDRADHLDKVFGALLVYVTVILDDTAQNAPGSLDLRDAEAVLADLASDVTGTIQQAADDMAGWVA
jgi:hypothetical protein